MVKPGFSEIFWKHENFTKARLFIIQQENCAKMRFGKTKEFIKARACYILGNRCLI